MDSTSSRRVRLACDSCHNMKMKCSGGQPCMTCTRYKHTCVYSAPNRIGRPKGSKNKTATSPLLRYSPSCIAPSRDRIEAETYWDQLQRPVTGDEGLADSAMTSFDEFIPRAPLATLSDYGLHTNAQSSSIPLSLPQPCLHDAVLSPSSTAPGSLEESYSLFPAHQPSSSYNLSQTQSHVPSTIAGASISRPNCSCVSIQAETLSSLRKREADPSPIAFPIVLEATQDIRARWEALHSCSLCRMDSDHVALLLLAVSLRLVLRWLQLVIYERVSLAHEPSVATAHTRQSSRGSNHLGMTGVPSPKVNRDEEGSMSSPISSRSRSRSSNPFLERIRIGHYDLPDEEHDFIMNMLTSRTLGRLKQTQNGITAYFQQFQSGLNYSMTGEKKSIHLVLDHLRHSIETTELLVQKGVQ